MEQEMRGPDNAHVKHLPKTREMKLYLKSEDGTLTLGFHL